jgi:hypothetical protein
MRTVPLDGLVFIAKQAAANWEFSKAASNQAEFPALFAHEFKFDNGTADRLDNGAKCIPY